MANGKWKTLKLSVNLIYVVQLNVESNETYLQRHLAL